MQKKYLKYASLILLFIIGISYTYCFRTLVDDEIYGFGFGINIVKGLIPYKDFNMIITPLFSYITALFISIMGKYLINYHILINLMLISITYLSYKKIGIKSIIIYLILLIYPYTGYNIFCVLLLFILLNLDKKNKWYLVLEVIIILMMILTKQVLGILVIPSLIYSKNRKKSFLMYLGIGLIFILSLILTGSLANFFDYCLFGMFDFGSKNSGGFNVLILIELIIIIYLIMEFIKKKDRDILYILCFQIMTFPIVNYAHFIISFAPFVYYLLKHNNKYLNFIICVFMVTFFIFFNLGITVRDKTYLYNSREDRDCFYKGRMVGKNLYDTIEDINDIIDNYNYDNYYLLGNFSYIVKLSSNRDINKFDLINDGNMGYKGSTKYIEEIDKKCSNSKCLFIIENKNKNTVNQTNMDILKYVNNNYIKLLGNNAFKVYRSR